MNKRTFLKTLVPALAGFSILPPATTYSRVWRAVTIPTLELWQVTYHTKDQTVTEKRVTIRQSVTSYLEAESRANKDDTIMVLYKDPGSYWKDRAHVIGSWQFKNGGGRATVVFDGSEDQASYVRVGGQLGIGVSVLGTTQLIDTPNIWDIEFKS